MLLTTLSQLGINIHSKNFFFRLQGDDSLIAFPKDTYRIYGKKFLTMMSEIAELRFNAKLSVDKSDIHEGLQNVYVLGYYNKSGRAYRHDVDLLSHLLFPERPQDAPSTAASALGLAMAAMGCSRPFYDTCLDIFNFIQKVEDKPVSFAASWIRKLKYLLGFEEIDTTRFPSFNETLMQNFITTGRSYADKQKTWPTDPSRTGGFCFI